MILAKIDVTKIDKAHLFKGAKGTYLDICLIETPNNEFDNDYMITQSVSKEEREKGVRGAILGNARIVGQKAAPTKPAEPTNPTGPAPEQLDEDEPLF